MDLLIKEEILEKAEITAEELIIEIAVHLYDIGRLSMGQARNLAQLDQISFQKELAKRDVYIQYDIKDLETDLENLRKLKGRKASWLFWKWIWYLTTDIPISIVELKGMIVVSDTSVITNLVQIDQLTLLKDLFGNIVIPQKVYDERNWLALR